MNRSVARLVPPTVTLVLLALLVRQLPPAELARLVRASSPRWLAAGAGLYLLVNLVRSARFSLLLNMPGVSGRRLLPLSFAVSLLNNILPLRGGELSFVVLARTHYHVATPAGTAVLGLARLFDYLAVATLFVPLAVRSRSRLPPTVTWPLAGLPTAWLLGGVAALVLAGMILALSLAGLGRRAVVLLRRLLTWRCGRERPMAQRALSFAERMVAALAVLRNRRTYALAFLLSLALWLVTFAWLYAFTRGVGRQVGPGLFIVGATFAVLSKALPLPTVGGLGVAEAGWTLGFTLVGWTVGEAIASGLAVTVLTLAVSAACGLPSLLLLGLPSQLAAGDT